MLQSDSQTTIQPDPSGGRDDPTTSAPVPLASFSIVPPTPQIDDSSRFVPNTLSLDRRKDGAPSHSRQTSAGTSKHSLSPVSFASPLPLSGAVDDTGAPIRPAPGSPADSPLTPQTFASDGRSSKRISADSRASVAMSFMTANSGDASGPGEAGLYLDGDQDGVEVMSEWRRELEAGLSGLTFDDLGHKVSPNANGSPTAAADTPRRPLSMSIEQPPAPPPPALPGGWVGQEDEDTSGASWFKGGDDADEAVTPVARQPRNGLPWDGGTEQGKVDLSRDVTIRRPAHASLVPPPADQPVPPPLPAQADTDPGSFGDPKGGPPFSVAPPTNSFTSPQLAPGVTTPDPNYRSAPLAVVADQRQDAVSGADSSSVTPTAPSTKPNLPQVDAVPSNGREPEPWQGGGVTQGRTSYSPTDARFPEDDIPVRATRPIVPLASSHTDALAYAIRDPNHASPYPPMASPPLAATKMNYPAGVGADPRGKAPGSSAAQQQQGYSPSATPIVPGQPSRPPAAQMEVCLECMMRDEDMADVHVVGPGLWDRESDKEFHEAVRLEEEEEERERGKKERAMGEGQNASAVGNEQANGRERSAVSSTDSDHVGGGVGGAGAGAAAAGSKAEDHREDSLRSAEAPEVFKGKARVRKYGKHDELTAERLKLWTSMNPPASSHRWRTLQTYLAVQNQLLEMEARARSDAERERGRLDMRMKDAYSQLRDRAMEAGPTGTDGYEESIRIRQLESKAGRSQRDRTSSVSLLKSGMILEHINVAREEREAKERDKALEKARRRRMSASAPTSGNSPELHLAPLDSYPGSVNVPGNSSSEERKRFSSPVPSMFSGKTGKDRSRAHTPATFPRAGSAYELRVGAGAQSSGSSAELAPPMRPFAMNGGTSRVLKQSASVVSLNRSGGGSVTNMHVGLDADGDMAHYPADAGRIVRQARALDSRDELSAAIGVAAMDEAYQDAQVEKGIKTEKKKKKKGFKGLLQKFRAAKVKSEPVAAPDEACLHSDDDAAAQLAPPPPLRSQLLSSRGMPGSPSAASLDDPFANRTPIALGPGPLGHIGEPRAVTPSAGGLRPDAARAGGGGGHHPTPYQPPPSPFSTNSARFSTSASAALTNSRPSSTWSGRSLAVKGGGVPPSPAVSRDILEESFPPTPPNLDGSGGLTASASGKAMRETYLSSPAPASVRAAFFGGGGASHAWEPSPSSSPRQASVRAGLVGQADVEPSGSSPANLSARQQKSLPPLPPAEAPADAFFDGGPGPSNGLGVHPQDMPRPSFQGSAIDVPASPRPSNVGGSRPYSIRSPLVQNQADFSPSNHPLPGEATASRQSFSLRRGTGAASPPPLPPPGGFVSSADFHSGGMRPDGTSSPPPPPRPPRSSRRGGGLPYESEAGSSAWQWSAPATTQAQAPAQGRKSKMLGKLAVPFSTGRNRKRESSGGESFVSRTTDGPDSSFGSVEPMPVPVPMPMPATLSADSRSLRSRKSFGALERWPDRGGDGGWSGPYDGLGLGAPPAAERRSPIESRRSTSDFVDRRRPRVASLPGGEGVPVEHPRSRSAMGQASPLPPSPILEGSSGSAHQQRTGGEGVLRDSTRQQHQQQEQNNFGTSVKSGAGEEDFSRRRRSTASQRQQTIPRDPDFRAYRYPSPEETTHAVLR